MAHLTQALDNSRDGEFFLRVPLKNLPDHWGFDRVNLPAPAPWLTHRNVMVSVGSDGVDQLSLPNTVEPAPGASVR